VRATSARWRSPRRRGPGRGATRGSATRSCSPSAGSTRRRATTSCSPPCRCSGTPSSRSPATARSRTSCEPGPRGCAGSAAGTTSATCSRRPTSWCCRRCGRRARSPRRRPCTPAGHWSRPPSASCPSSSGTAPCSCPRATLRPSARPSAACSTTPTRRRGSSRGAGPSRPRGRPLRNGRAGARRLRRAGPMRRSLLAVLVLLLVVLPAAPVHSSPAPDVVVVGVAGLQWSSVGPHTPVLRSLAAAGATGVLSVKAVPALTCRADGWLTLGAGTRALAVPDQGDGRCAAVPLADLDEQVRANAATLDGARVGALRDVLGDRARADGEGARLRWGCRRPVARDRSPRPCDWSTSARCPRGPGRTTCGARTAASPPPCATCPARPTSSSSASASPTATARPTWRWRSPPVRPSSGGRCGRRARGAPRTCSSSTSRPPCWPCSASRCRTSWTASRGRCAHRRRRSPTSWRWRTGRPPPARSPCRSSSHWWPGCWRCSRRCTAGRPRCASPP
jgi:hypothetical protein